MGGTLATYKSGEKVMAPLSVSQIGTIHANYRHHFSKELENPTASSNHILNFNLKVENFLMLNSFTNMLLAGASTFMVKYLFNNNLIARLSNYTGQKRADTITMIIYFACFFYIKGRMDKLERCDINYLINPREL